MYGYLILARHCLNVKDTEMEPEITSSCFRLNRKGYLFSLSLFASHGTLKKPY